MLDITEKHKHRPNRLINEKSPYLLQHAHNPVDWFPWGPEAFQRAQREGKPVFLSIGYSTCHWCHVMERESFEDEEVANLLNNHFVSIKVDREERPDIDHIYMTVCQAMTGRGGWPMSLFLTPEKHPFFAGTYFPKNSRYGMRGFVDLLKQIQEKWGQDRARIEESGLKIVDMLQSVSKTAMADSPDSPDRSVIDEAVAHFNSNFDAEYGGFGDEPKFPSPHQLLFLMRRAGVASDAQQCQDLLRMVERTLDAMTAGGIYDHVGGGFSRYSTDRMWLVPHFEKMLYDNALLAYTYVEAFQVFSKPLYKAVAKETFDYLLRDMYTEDGAFYAAEDADSEGVEGLFYLWSPQEITAVLGPELGAMYCRYYDITEAGNFEDKNIPNRIGTTLEEFCTAEGLAAEEWQAQVHEANLRLVKVRGARVRPARDNKVLTGWNALTIAAFARAGRVFDEERYVKAAERAMEWIQTVCRSTDGRLMARYCDGDVAVPGYLDDFAFLVWAAIELYEATWDPSYLQQAVLLQESAQELFWDREDGGYFFTGHDAEVLLARPKEWYDGAVPSGNSVMAWNLQKLAQITGDARWSDFADKQLRSCMASARKYPAGFTFYLTALQYALWPSREIVVAGPHDEETDRLLTELQQGWFPQAALLYRPDTPDESTGLDILKELAPFVLEQRTLDGRLTLYVCENRSCQVPMTNVGNILQWVEKTSMTFQAQFPSPR